MPNVGINGYWLQRLKAWVASGVRASMSQIVEEALAAYATHMEREKEQWEELKDTKQTTHIHPEDEEDD